MASALPTMRNGIFSREYLRVGGGYGAPALGQSPAGGLDIDAGGNMATNGDITVRGETHLVGLLTAGAMAAGASTFTGSFVVTGNSLFTGTMTLAGALSANSISTFNGAIAAGSGAISGGSLTVTGAIGGATLATSSHVTVGGDLVHAGDMNVCANSGAGDTTVYVKNSDSTYKASLDVEKDVVVHGLMTVNGTIATNNADIDAGTAALKGGSLAVTGGVAAGAMSAITGGSLTVGGAMSGTSLTVTGDVNVGNNLVSTANLDIDAQSALMDTTVHIKNSEAAYKASLDVENHLTVGGNLTVTGSFTIATLSVSAISGAGNISIDAHSAAADTLVAIANSDATKKADVSIQRHLEVGGNLEVVGTITTTNANIDAGTALLKGGALEISGDITGSGDTSIDAYSAAGDTTVYVKNSDGTRKASLDVEKDLSVGGKINASNIHNNGGTGSTGAVASGTYTPTLTAGSGVTNETVSTAFWTRIGQVVNVTAYISFDTSGTSAQIGVSLPIASNLAGAQLLGVAVGLDAQGVVADDSVNDRADVVLSTTAGSRSITVNFQYLVQ